MKKKKKAETNEMIAKNANNETNGGSEPGSKNVWQIAKHKKTAKLP